MPLLGILWSTIISHHNMPIVASFTTYASRYCDQNQFLLFDPKELLYEL